MSERIALQSLGLLPLMFFGLLAATGACASEVLPPVKSWDFEVERARAHLAAEMGADADLLLVKRIERMQWGDTSLGCPEPGKGYLPVVTDGLQVTFVLDKLEYRVNLAGELVLSCERSRGASLRKTGRQSSPAMALFLKASGDLAERLDVPRSNIRLADIETQLWAGDEISCDSEPAAAGTAGFRGYQLTLASGGTLYVYKCSDEEARFCGPADGR